MFANAKKREENSVNFYDFHPKVSDLFLEVKKSLSQKPKSIHPKFLYDAQGSKLFHQITQLPEYYPTRVELELLSNKGKEIAKQLKDDTVIIEYGCGSSEKIHRLLDALPNLSTYVAIDISKEPLLELTDTLAESYPSLEVMALCADFTTPLELPLNGNHQSSKRVAFFPGSSIGNFEPKAAIQFLKTIHQEVGPEGGLLIGVDLKKNTKTLHHAYNDSQGVTAAFNKNILERINRECSADFKPKHFTHQALYNQKLGRIEMHLVSEKAQTVLLKDTPLSFEKGETIHTENSYKYHVEEFQKLASQAGWKPVHIWMDEEKFFSLQYLEWK